MTDEARAGNVVEALARVARDLPGIGKDSRAAPDQGGYAYRGIEAITQAVQPLLAREGIVFVPAVQLWVRDEVLVGRDKKVWHDDRMQIVYTVYGPAGADDKIEVGPIPAIGRDGTDKGANKCMTQAFKYALLQVLCVADSKDDGDNQHQEAERDQEPEPITYVTEEQVAEIKRLGKAIKDAGGDPGGPWPSVLGTPTIVDGEWAIDHNAADALIVRLQEALTKIVGAGDAMPPSEETAIADATVGDAEPASPAPGGAHGYGLWPRADLEAECKEREIPHSGNMDRLVRELRAWDVVYRPGEPEYDVRQF